MAKKRRGQSENTIVTNIGAHLRKQGAKALKTNE